MDRVFLAPAEFDRRIVDGELLEWSRIGSHRRGTPYPPLRARLDAGQPVLLPLDLRGVPLVRARLPDARLVLLSPPGYAPDATVAATVEHALTHDHTERVVDGAGRLTRFFLSGSGLVARARLTVGRR